MEIEIVEQELVPIRGQDAAPGSLETSAPAVADIDLYDDELVEVVGRDLRSEQSPYVVPVSDFSDSLLAFDSRGGARRRADLGAKSEVIGVVERRLGRDHEIRFTPDTSLPPMVGQVEVPIVRLHCPKHAGCSATETWTRDLDTSAELKMSFAGVGAGVALSTKMQVRGSWTAENGTCLETVMPARTRVEFGSLSVRGTKFAMVFLVTITNLSQEGQTQRPIPAEHDVCLSSSADAHGMFPFAGPFTQAAGKRKLGWKVGASITGSASVDLSFLDEKFGVGLAYKRTSSSSFDRDFTIAEGATYQPYIPSENRNVATAPEIFWETRSP
jgi:hypothetical protein